MRSTDIDLQSRPALAARVRLQIDPVNGEPVLLYPEGLLRLNPTAHEVVARCDGQNTITAILYSLGQEFSVDAETLQSDVLTCLGELVQRQLLTLNT